MTLKSVFARLEDPRKGPARRHDLREMILIALRAVLWGCIVTIDAIGCQTKIAQKILERGGDYLLAVTEDRRQKTEDRGQRTEDRRQ